MINIISKMIKEFSCMNYKRLKRIIPPTILHHGIEKYYQIKHYLDIEITRNRFPYFSSCNYPIVVVGLPGSLCLLDLNFRFFLNNQEIILFANGMSSWEQLWIEKNLNVAHCVFHKGTMISHGKVIDLCVDKISQPFGIIDFDCFVFNPCLYKRMKSIKENTLLNACFARYNPIKDYYSPETFFMYLNPVNIRKIQKKYSVSNEMIRYCDLDNSMKQILQKINITSQTPIEYDKPDYLDTTRLIVALGLYEGYEVNFVERFTTKSSEGVFHVGAGHHNNALDSYWNIRGTYFWRRALEKCPHKELQEYYYDKYGAMTTDDIRIKIPDIEKQLGDSYLKNVDKLLADLNV